MVLGSRWRERAVGLRTPSRKSTGHSRGSGELAGRRVAQKPTREGGNDMSGLHEAGEKMKDVNSATLTVRTNRPLFVCSNMQKATTPSYAFVRVSTEAREPQVSSLLFSAMLLSTCTAVDAIAVLYCCSVLRVFVCLYVEPSCYGKGCIVYCRRLS